MRMALRELRRRPKAFLVPVSILALLALLLLFPSSILDGIVQEVTAGMRNVPADLVVYSKAANGVQLRSQIDAQVRGQVDAVPGTGQVSTFDVLVLAGVPEGKTDADAVSLALTASNESLRTPIPATGEAIADESLRTGAGIAEGTKIAVGPFKKTVTITGFTSGSNLYFANGLIVSRETMVGMFPPPMTPEQVAALPSQALLVKVDDGAEPKEVAAAIDEATAGQTITMTRDRAVKATPGIEQQEITFGYMRGITLLVALVVVALFLSFMTLERAPLYAAMKAIGASSRQLFSAVILQVIVITAVAISAATAMTYGLTRLPSAMPTVLQPARLVETTVALGFTALLGACLSLRRVMSVDAKDALG
jgi:hypothetical protein